MFNLHVREVQINSIGISHPMANIVLVLKTVRLLQFSHFHTLNMLEHILTLPSHLLPTKASQGQNDGIAWYLISLCDIPVFIYFPCKCLALRGSQFIFSELWVSNGLHWLKWRELPKLAKHKVLVKCCMMSNWDIHQEKWYNDGVGIHFGLEVSLWFQNLYS